MKTDNRHIRLQFNIMKASDFEYADAQTLVGKPIIINEVPMGVITYAVSNKEKEIYECEGIIWDKFVNAEYSIDKNKVLTLMGVVI